MAEGLFELTPSALPVTLAVVTDTVLFALLEGASVRAALLALMESAASFICEIESEIEYCVVTSKVVRCNHGIVYSPILQEHCQLSAQSCCRRNLLT